MQVSVVVCTYARERYDDFVEAVESVLEQTYDPLEVVLVVDGNEDVFELVQADFGDRENVVTHCNSENRGVSASRTRGAELASGDVVAFIDDDAIADPDWIAELVDVYESTGALAVGGQMTGEWVAGRPWYLPEEFYWLVGVTYPGFADDGAEVRNTFESNISFRRDVFLELGGFDPELGPTADTYSHSEGAEIGSRLRAKYGCGVIYTSEAVVRHKVFEHRTQLRWLLMRAFKQGQSKRSFERQTTGSTGEEFGYLRTLFTSHIPQRLQSLVRSPKMAAIGQLVMLLVLTIAVGVGYLSETITELISR